METTTNIPLELHELGVVSISKRQLGFDLEYQFTFADGDIFTYRPRFSAWGDQDMAPKYQFNKIVEAVRNHRVLPFE